MQFSSTFWSFTYLVYSVFRISGHSFQKLLILMIGCDGEVFDHFRSKFFLLNTRATFQRDLIDGVPPTSSDWGVWIRVNNSWYLWWWMPSRKPVVTYRQHCKRIANEQDMKMKGGAHSYLRCLGVKLYMLAGYSRLHSNTGGKSSKLPHFAAATLHTHSPYSPLGKVDDRVSWLGVKCLQWPGFEPKRGGRRNYLGQRR